MTSEADIFEYQSKRPVTTRTGFGGLDLSAEEGQFTVIYDGWDGTPFRVRNIEVERYLSKTKNQTTVDKDGKFKIIGESIPAFVKNKEEAKVVSGDTKGFITLVTPTHIARKVGVEAREQGEEMLLETKTIESIWNDTVNTIKISDAKQTYQDYLDKHNLETLPVPEWSNQVDMAYFWLQSSVNGQLVWEKLRQGLLGIVLSG